MTEHIDTDELAMQIKRLMRIRIPLLAAIVFNIYLLTGVSATAKRPPQKRVVKVQAKGQNASQASENGATSTADNNIQGNNAPAASKIEAPSQTDTEPQIDFTSVDPSNAVAGFQNVATSMNRVARFTGLANADTPTDRSFIQRGIGGLLKTLPKTIEDQPGNDDGNQSNENKSDTSLSNSDTIEVPPVVTTVAEFITITNSRAIGGPVSFKLGTEIITLSAGESVKREANSVQVVFDRGATFGIHRDELTTGNYQFRVNGKRGWYLESDE